MLGPSWIELFERIPGKLHDSVALTLVTGAEIIMQSLLRLESDYAILRGRMAGSTDAGRVIILPYDQIVNLAFTKRMLEPEVEAVFGTLMTPAVAQAAPAAEEAAALDEAAEEQEEAATQGVAVPMKTSLPPPAAAAAKAAPPSKSILLARLRQRLAEQGKQ